MESRREQKLRLRREKEQNKTRRSEHSRIMGVFASIASLPRMLRDAFLSGTKRERVIRYDGEDSRRVAQMLRNVSGEKGTKLGPSSRGVVKLADERA